jgi:hypothetical protein
MARPERNTVDYFPFYCEEGKKMFYIEQTYGNDGFAVFVKLLRELAKTDYHYLDLSTDTTAMYLSAKCRVKTELMNAVIDDLAKLGKFHFELWFTYKIIWCDDFINSIQDAYARRNNKCIDLDGLCKHLRDNCNTLIKLTSKTGNKKPHIKEDYNKEEEIKSWKEDFEIYKNELREAFKTIITPEYISERQNYHPKLNIKLTIEKAVKDYWILEAGWKNKKGKRTKNIDWKSTFNNALSQKQNQVWQTNTESATELYRRVQ